MNSLSQIFPINKILFLWKKIIGFLLFITVVLFCHIKLLPYAFDDAYIHFRIARNFIQYRAPYYNPGEMVMASSSSGWTLFVTGAFSLFSIDPLVISIFNSLFTCIGAFIFLSFFRPSKYIFLFPVLYISLVLYSSIGLMELPLSMMLLGFSLLLFKNRHSGALIIFGMLPFFRLELIFFSGIFCVFSLISKRFKLQQSILFPIAGSLPFLIYDLLYFHTVIPNTVYAKLSGYDATIPDTVLSMLKQFLPGAGEIGGIIVIILFLVILINSLRKKNKNDIENKLIMLSGFLVMLFYIFSRSLIFPWYVPIFTVPILLPLLKTLLSPNPFSANLLILAILTPAFVVTGKTVIAASINPTLYASYEAESRVTKYIEVGERLFQEYPQSRLLTSEIGGLGWGFEGYILDGFGLASPEAIKYQKGGTGLVGSIPLEFIEVEVPELIVSHDIFISGFVNSPLSNNYFLQQESIYTDREGMLWGGKNLNIYIRKDLFSTN